MEYIFWMSILDTTYSFKSAVVENLFSQGIDFHAFVRLNKN